MILQQSRQQKKEQRSWGSTNQPTLESESGDLAICQKKLLLAPGAVVGGVEMGSKGGSFWFCDVALNSNEFDSVQFGISIASSLSCLIITYGGMMGEAPVTLSPEKTSFKPQFKWKRFIQLSLSRSSRLLRMSRFRFANGVRIKGPSSSLRICFMGTGPSVVATLRVCVRACCGRNDGGTQRPAAGGGGVAAGVGCWLLVTAAGAAGTVND
uniref:Uncharacterized protein n=1 Tax=Glossina austeni TaxID=7395 RepID=A0A1A9USS5_GLOAU